MHRPVDPKPRRDLLKALGGLGALAALGCGATTSTTDAGSSLVTDGGIDTASFAVGSGAFLTGKDYGNPFTTGLGATCTAWKAATQGPCHSNTFDRKDLSDGLVGLPTRFELLVVDRACAPVPNAIVEVWYASPAGTYSEAATAIDAGTGYGGSLADLNVGFCTGNDATALSSNWLRGYQTAGSDGRVTFDGIYPGWYASRTTHVHFVVTVGSTRYITSQLFIDDAINTLVYTTHGSYKSRGQKDTTNAADKVVSESGLTVADVTMSYGQQRDGALVLWKAITIAA
jgi:protocatechuate 3,4-dioxygenase beta subunit